LKKKKRNRNVLSIL